MLVVCCELQEGGANSFKQCNHQEHPGETDYGPERVMPGLGASSRSRAAPPNPGAHASAHSHTHAHACTLTRCVQNPGPGKRILPHPCGHPRFCPPAESARGSGSLVRRSQGCSAARLPGRRTGRAQHPHPLTHKGSS